MVVLIHIKSQGKTTPLAKGLPSTFTFPNKTLEQITVAEVKAAVHEKFPKFPTSRQKLTLPDSKKQTLKDDATVAEALSQTSEHQNVSGVGPDEVTLCIKDLGPQVGWRTVFIVEYLGPLIIHPLVYHLPKLFYGKDFEHSQVQYVAYCLVLAHFFKRELESIFVHRFSHATMPLMNIFKNSAHYHLLSGVLLAGGVYGPWYSAQALAGARRSDPRYIAGFTGLFVLAELLNLQTHITLRNLRPAGTRTRGIPMGGLFSFVSCPNYFSEALAWTAVAGLTMSPFAFLFLVVSAGQMGVWAMKKHRSYKKEFGKEYPKGRKAMVPFIF